MNLEYLRGNYEFASGKVSDIVRQLSLTAIAIVWIFKLGTLDKPAIDPKLYAAAFWAVLALSLDLLQYLLMTVIYFLYLSSNTAAIVRTTTKPPSKSIGNSRGALLSSSSNLKVCCSTAKIFALFKSSRFLMKELIKKKGA